MTKKSGMRIDAICIEKNKIEWYCGKWGHKFIFSGIYKVTGADVPYLPTFKVKQQLKDEWHKAYKGDRNENYR
jgi:hypothetical protein